jgi:uncharacterized protein
VGIDEKLAALERIVSATGGACLAFSGGADSTFLARVASRVLGERFLAVTAASETYPARERRQAVDLAARLGFRHAVIETSELGLPGFRTNPPDRCYHCKKELFTRLRKVAEREGLPALLDGQNADDAGDYRPGARAAAELDVKSPLREAGLAKAEIRELSRREGLPTWDKPALACLASRFPYGREITAESLARVEAAEEYLRGLGLGQLRVRHHGDIARIEVKPADMAALAGAEREGVVRRLRELGYAYVSLDLEGYRTGSMNEVL